MSFTTIVRPFAAPAPIATTRIKVVTTQVPDETASISWGDAGTLIDPQQIGGTAEDSGGISYQLQSCNSTSTEQTRKTVTQRITNADDSSQFIDVQIPQNITFKLKPQKSILQSGFKTATTTFADNDELYSEISEVLDPPDLQDTCQQSFSFALPNA